MSLITIAAGDVIEYHGTKVPHTARLFANKKFTTNDGIVVAHGTPGHPKDFYQEFGASLVGANIRIATGDAYTTTNSDFPDATYTLCVFDAKGHQILTVYTRLRISTEMDPTTWQNIKDYSAAVRLTDAPTYMNSDILLRMFDDIYDGAALGSDAQHGVMRLDVPAEVLTDPVAVGENSPLITTPAGVGSSGKTKLDVAPVDPANPIAVGVNSPLVTTMASDLAFGKTALSVPAADPAQPVALGANDPVLDSIEQNLNDYATLPDAIVGIGAAQTNLIVKNPISVSADTSIPDNITLDIKDDGVISVATGKTLIIGNMKNPGSRKVFDGNGRVKFARGAVEKMDVTWWAGATDNVNVSSNIDEMLLSCIDNGGGKLFFPDGRWLSDGNHVVPTGTTIEGGGSSSDSLANSGMTVVILQQDGVPLFKIVESTNNIRFRSIKLEGDDHADSTGILCEGMAPNQSSDLYCESVAIHGFTNNFRVNSLVWTAPPPPTDPGAWQFALASFKKCSFSLASNAAVKINTPNTGVRFDDCMFYAANPAAVIFDIANCGTFNAIGCEFAGLGADPDEYCVGGAPSTLLPLAVVRATGQHLPMNFIGCQDEGFQNFILHETPFADYYSSYNLIGNLIQAPIFLKAGCVVNSLNNNYRSHTFKDDADGDAVVVSQGDFIQNKTVCGVVVNPPKLDDFVGNSFISFEANPTTHHIVMRQMTKIFSPSLYNGHPTYGPEPLLSLGHFTTIEQEKPMIRLGRMNKDGNFIDGHYDVTRNIQSGRLTLVGSEAQPRRGYDFDSDVYANGAIRNAAIQMVDGSVVTIQPKLGNNFYVLLEGNRSIAVQPMSVADQSRADGQIITVKFIQDATGSRVATFVSGAGQFAFGTDLPAIVLSTAANAKDIARFQYDKLSDTWLAIDLKKGFA